MTQLKALDGLATEVLNVRQGDASPVRRRHEEDRLVYRIHETLKPTIRKMMSGKGMLDILDEGEQHGYIAIHTALKDWDSNLSSFSTFVHWKLRAEMRTLELHHFPQRRKVCDKINVRLIPLNKPCAENSDGENDELGNVMNLDPYGYEKIEDNVDSAMFRRNIDHALSRVALPRINKYIKTGFIQREPVFKIMRDIHIFMQRMLGDKNANYVAECHGITRERVRQITGTIQESFAKHIGDLMQNPKHRTESEDLSWELALAIYNDDAEIDIRLLHGVTSTDRHGSTLAQHDALPMRPSEDIEYEIRQMDNEPKVAQLALIADAYANKQIAQADSTAPVSDAARVRAQEMEIIEDPSLATRARTPAQAGKQWAVKVSEHPTKYALMTAARGIIERHPELKRCRPSMIESANGNGMGLAFGALEMKEADRLCSILEQRGETCKRIRIGNG